MNPQRPVHRKHAIVIGAGIGGIATSIHLAQQGFQVSVIEKNARPGGRCDQVSFQECRFDLGPTLLIMPLVYAAEFDALGLELHSTLELQRVDPTYHLVFDDGSRLALTSDLRYMREQLEGIEAGSFGGYLRYLEEGRSHYDLAMARLVNRDFRRASEFFTPANLPLLLQLKALLPHYRHMGRYFRTARLKAAFSFQDVYMGLNPFSAPSTFSMMPYTELAHGVWYPMGGMYAIVQALVQRAIDLGVVFTYETSVRRIAVDGVRVTGVVLEDQSLVDADLVVANADLPYVYDKLLPDRRAAKRMNDKAFSCSVISFFWALDRQSPSIPPHMLFLAGAYRENFERIDQGLPLPPESSLYLHAPARLDATAAPEGGDAIIAVVPISHMATPDLDGDVERERWMAAQENARAAVMRRLRLVGVDNLDAHIVQEMTFTPLSWCNRYNLSHGATHGLAHTLFQLGYLRPHNRHARYRNLYFVGASTHPGTGIPTALISARLVAERIRDETA